MQTTAKWPGFELTVEREDQFVESGGDELNPEWRFVDENGHGHFVSPHEADRLPTLEWVSMPCTMGHDDCTSEGSYECRACRVEVRPGTRPARPVRIVGESVYTLKTYDDGVESTYRFYAPQWEQLQAGIVGMVREALADFVVEMRHTGPSRSR